MTEKQSSTPSSRHQQAVKRVYDALAGDPMSWGQTFFPKHFRMGSPGFHYELIDSAMREQHLVVAAPRGSAKSTLLAFLYPFHAIVFKRRRFIVILSNTFKKAAMHLDSIKKELVDNQELKQVFPPIELTRDAEGDTIFRHADGFETLVLCKGVDQLGSIRGVKFRAYRPDLILIDDLEDDELVKSPERRSELRDEFDEVLNQVGDRGTQFIMVGTVLHDDCQLAKVLKDGEYGEFKKIIFRAHLNPGKPDEASLWPEKWTLDELHELRRTKPNVYAKEMQNDPVAGSNVRFKREDFRRWSIDGSDYILHGSDGTFVGRGSLRDCKAAISFDLAWEEGKDSDFCVMMPGLLTPNSDILIYKYFAKKGVRPHQITEWFFVMVDSLENMTKSPVVFGSEKAMLEKVVAWILRQEMKKRNKFVQSKELVWEGDKITRAEMRLEPRYSQNAIFHMEGMGELEYQLTRFPYGAHDDLVDAAQGLVQLLQYPKNATVAAAPVDQFTRLQKLVRDAKKGQTFAGFGQKKIVRGIPARDSLW